MQFRIDLFNKFDLTREEKEFIENANLMGAHREDINPADIYKVIGNFYLAKQIEESSKSSDRAAKWMFRLTISIATLPQCKGICHHFGEV